MISETSAAAEALSLADDDVLQGRLRRLKRASDLSYKAKMMQDYVPASTMAALEPFTMDLSADIDKIKARNVEYGILDLHKK